MRRRRFIHASIASAGVAAVAGCIGADDTENADGEFPAFDLPRYSDWVPAESHQGPGAEVFFTHVDWDAIDELDDDEDPEDDDQVEDVVEQIPIVGLPMYGAIISPLAVFGILLYPFAEYVLPEEGVEVEGIRTSTMTWTDDLLVLYGDYSPDVFAEQYADGFETGDERNGFTLYVGDDVFTEGMAYAVSENSLLVGMHAGEDDDYVPEDVVRGALDRNLEEMGRMVDDEDGQWLFETTGEAQMGFGGWQTDNLMDALDPDDEVDEEAAEPEADPNVDDNPVYDRVESVVNNLVYTVEDGEMSDLEARFSGLYPDDAVPSEEEVREYLIGTPEVPHDIVIDGTRVHATATFDESPTI